MLTDSHGRGLEKILNTERPDLWIYSIIVGDVTRSLRSQYNARLRGIYQFMPDIVILHCGHNDLVHHPRHNNSPSHGKYFFPEVESFVKELQEDHPLALVIYSSIFPRTVCSNFTLAQKLIYNRLAVRFGAMARSSSNTEGYVCVLNGGLWSKVRKFIEHPRYFLPDGLHLNDEGRKVVCAGWISVLPKVSVPDCE
jgi:lysophospholipase L1-like esterase